MGNLYEMANRILANCKLSSDNLDFIDCYYLCANKQHIEELRTKDHQVIWGRRGTGKTTLQKAFVYDVNYLQQNPATIALYVVMANIIPTDEEIDSLTGDGSSLAVYVFSKLIDQICKELESIFNIRSMAMEDSSEVKFIKAYDELQDYLTIYQTYIQGGELSIDNLKSNEIKKEIGYEIGTGVKIAKILDACVNIFRKHSNTSNLKQSVALSGKLRFRLETQIISAYIKKMLEALGISFMYICLDEYSEIDKVSKYTIQSKVAQLIKQVFFKNAMFSVKIATIWNRSKLHSRGGNRVEGIEYKQDIFPGPDLDIMFMENNNDIIRYFKEILINTYLMGEEVKGKEKDGLSDYFETDIFGKNGLRHLVCGSQGVSRAFVILVKEYLYHFLKDKSGPVKQGIVYELIRHQYLEDVRNKIPYYSLYQAIDEFTSEKLCRYFLITRKDYHRCKSLIHYLAARGLFMQLPGQLTDRRIRDKYKLFVIHYGNYLDALESANYKSGRKKLEEDAKLEADGMLVPEYAPELTTAPWLYTVPIPEGIENEIFCTNCGEMFISDVKEDSVICPYCGHRTTRFAEFINEVAL